MTTNASEKKLWMAQIVRSTVATTVNVDKRHAQIKCRKINIIIDEISIEQQIARTNKKKKRRKNWIPSKGAAIYL